MNESHIILQNMEQMIQLKNVSLSIQCIVAHHMISDSTHFQIESETNKQKRTKVVSEKQRKSPNQKSETENEL